MRLTTLDLLINATTLTQSLQKQPLQKLIEEIIPLKKSTAAFGKQYRPTDLLLCIMFNW